MPKTLAHVTFLVRNCDEALAFFTGALGFRLVEDTRLSENKCCLLVPSQHPEGTPLLLAEATTPEQDRAIGKQAGDRVFLFLHTDDFWRDYCPMQASDVKFLEAPRHESYGIVVVSEDLYGNKWDLLQPNDQNTPKPLPLESR